MHYTGLTYRPPFEAQSLLLQVTTGCSHNRCAFCTMYRDVPFGVSPEEHLLEDLQEASAYAPFIDRAFLENGDAFCLSADRLKAIAEKVHAYLPKVQTITMYASIKNIRDKSDDELRMLRALGINELNIGVESGLDDALSYMNKGYNAAEAVTQLKRLKDAGMTFGANIILGVAGPERKEENAEATARLLNETKPYLIFVGTLHYAPGCPLYDDLQSGEFTENTIGEYLDEEELLLSKLELDDCLLFGLHPSNIVRMQGYLNRDKAEMIEEVRRQRVLLERKLGERPVRGGEGAVILHR